MGIETGSRIDDISLAHEEALKEYEGRVIAEELGIGDRAGDMIEAHGQRYSVGAALKECEPFKDMVASVVETADEMGLADDGRDKMLNKVIDKMVDKTKNAPIPDEVQGKAAREKAANEAVKKN